MFIAHCTNRECPTFGEREEVKPSQTNRLTPERFECLGCNKPLEWDVADQRLLVPA